MSRRLCEDGDVEAVAGLRWVSLARTLYLATVPDEAGKMSVCAPRFPCGCGQGNKV